MLGGGRDLNAILTAGAILGVVLPHCKFIVTARAPKTAIY